MKPRDRATAEGILFTDQYQLTMAQLYYRTGLHEARAQFDYFFRHYPHYGAHQAGYCINAGLEWLLDWMREARFRDEDISLLRRMTGTAGGAFSGMISWTGYGRTALSMGFRCAPSRREEWSIRERLWPSSRAPW